MSNANVGAPLVWEGEEKQRGSLGALPRHPFSEEKRGFLSWIPSEKQPCLFPVDKWGHFHLEISGLLVLGTLLGCPLDADRIKTGLFAKGQILNYLPHDPQSAVIFASLGLKG